MLRDKINQNPQRTNDLRSKRGGVKFFASVNGRLFLRCRCTSFPNGREFSSVEIGESSGNPKSSFERMKEGAKINAIFKHHANGGSKSKVEVEILGYDIIYFSDEISFKRENQKGKYRVIGRYKGKIISNDAYTFKKYNQNV